MSDDFNRNNDFIYNSNNENENKENDFVEVFTSNNAKPNWTYSYAEENHNNNFNNSNINSGRVVEENRESKRRKKHPYFSQMVATLVACVICSGLVGGVLSYNFSTQIDKQNAIIEQLQNGSNYTSNFVGASYTSEPKDISSIVAEVSPSVVGISLDVTIDSYGMSRNFFNMGPQQATLEGSGIVISEDGYIVTNYHVVSYADPYANSGSSVTVDSMKVHFSDGTIADATFVGGDEDSDLAVIKVNLTNLKAATLGDSSSLKAGDTAIAIGNPLGLDFAGTVTQGIISAVNRNVETEEGTMMNLIQTDAAINEGNSGGALVNANGEVIGINSAKIAATGVEGIGFAIPINDAKVIINSLIK